MQIPFFEFIGTTVVLIFSYNPLISIPRWESAFFH